MAQVWVGLAHVRPRHGNDLLKGDLGAFVPSVGLAENDDAKPRRRISVISIIGTCFKNRIVRVAAFLSNGAQTKNQHNGTNRGCPLCLHDFPPQWIF